MAFYVIKIMRFEVDPVNGPTDVVMVMGAGNYPRAALKDLALRFLARGENDMAVAEAIAILSFLPRLKVGESACFCEKAGEVIKVRISKS